MTYHVSPEFRYQTDDGVESMADTTLSFQTWNEVKEAITAYLDSHAMCDEVFFAIDKEGEEAYLWVGFHSKGYNLWTRNQGWYV